MEPLTSSQEVSRKRSASDDASASANAPPAKQQKTELPYDKFPARIVPREEYLYDTDDEMENEPDGPWVCWKRGIYSDDADGVKKWHFSKEHDTQGVTTYTKIIVDDDKMQAFLPPKHRNNKKDKKKARFDPPEMRELAKAAVRYLEKEEREHQARQRLWKQHDAQELLEECHKRGIFTAYQLQRRLPLDE